MIIEKIILDRLNVSLPDPVYMEVPPDPPGRFYVLEKTGSGETDQICRSSFALQSYAPTLYEAALMNSAGKIAMLNTIVLSEVTDAQLNSDYNFTDTAKKQYRYQAVFDIYHYKGDDT